MAVTLSLYNHTAQRFASGANAAAAIFNATHTTLAATGGTESAGNTSGILIFTVA